MIQRHIERTISNIRRRPGRHVATALCLAVAFLALGAFGVGFFTLQGGVARWGGSYEVTVYLHDDADAPTVAAVLAAQPEVQSSRAVAPASAKKRLAHLLGVGAGLDELPADAFPPSFELRLKPDARTPDSARALAARLGTAPGVASVETYGPWLERVTRLIRLSRAAALGFGVLVLCLVFVVVGFAARLARAERAQETELLRIVGATPSYIEVPLTLEGAIQGFAGAIAASIGIAVGVAILRGVGASLEMPPLWTASMLALGGALVGALAARRTAALS
jgi:cell division transport system permease protein